MYPYHGLKGSDRIVFDDICRLLASGEPVSIARLADASGYSESTIKRAVKRLRTCGMIEVHHQRGMNAEYRIRGDNMDLTGLFKAIINAITMSSDERARRLAMAYIAKQCYNDGRTLRRLAGQVGGEVEANALRFLEQNHILDRYRVWPLDEANELHAELERRIARVKLILENGHDPDGAV